MKDKGPILLLSETIFVELTSELRVSGKLLKTTYLDIHVIFRAILLDFSIKKSQRVAAMPGKQRINSVHNKLKHMLWDTNWCYLMSKCCSSTEINIFYFRPHLRQLSVHMKCWVTLKSNRTKKQPEKTANLEGSPKQATSLISSTANKGKIKCFPSQSNS